MAKKNMAETCRRFTTIII